MGRGGTLWGTRENEYCELGRSEGLEELLRRLGAVSPELALEETRQLLSGCSLPGEGQRGPGAHLTIRYSPVHLYKRQPILAEMDSFAAFCTCGPEDTEGGRESSYSHLTLLDREELFSDGEPDAEAGQAPYGARAASGEPGSADKQGAAEGQDTAGKARLTFLDRIFGTPLMMPEAEKKIRNGAEHVNLAPTPGKVSPEIRENEKKLLSLLVTALYSDADCRVVLRMPETGQFERDSLRLLAEAYSLLPAKMAVETGFSIGEQPAEITERIGKANLRIFVLRAETAPDPARDFPENTVFLDLAGTKELPENYDTELDRLIRRWAELPWEKRRSAMEYCLADEEEYFRREYYAEGSRQFLEHPFWLWKEKKDRRFDPKGAAGFEARYREVKELYQLYAQFDICRRLPWVREEFVRSLPEFLMEGDSIPLLRQAVVRKAADAGEANPNTVENCRGYRRWLTSLMDPAAPTDDSFECAALAAEDALKKAEASRKEELEKRLSEKDALLSEKDEKLAAKDRLLQEKEQKYAELQAEIDDKEAQWLAFVDSLEQQLGAQTVEETAADAARKLNPQDAKKVDALLLDLTEAREENDELQEELRKAKEQLDYEKHASSRRRSQEGAVIRKLKLALIGVFVLSLLLGAFLGMKFL